MRERQERQRDGGSLYREAERDEGEGGLCALSGAEREFPREAAEV